MKLIILFLSLLSFTSLKSQNYRFVPLLQAVKEDNPEKIKLALENGANIEERISDFNDTPLDYAVKFNHQRAAFYLLESGAKSRRYLDDAVLTGDINWVNFLLSKNYYDPEILMAGVESKSYPMVDFLIQCHFPVDFIQKQRISIFKKRFASPIDVAIANIQPDIVLLLAKHGANLNKSFEFFFEMHEYDRCDTLIKKLISENVDISPYYLKSFNYYNTKLIQKFVDNGVDVYSFNIEGYNGLHISLMKGSKELVDYCLKKLHFNFATLSRNNETAFMLATKSTEYVFFKSVFDTAHYQINQVDNKGNSLLNYAIETRDDGIIDAVLAKNPNLNLQNDLGETVMMLLLKRGDLDIYKKIWLKSRDHINFKLKTNENHDLLGYYTAFYPQVWASINAYIKLGCDPKLDNVNGENLAYYLASRNDLNGLREAQKLGVSMIPHNRFNEAPTNAPFVCVQFLVQNGASINQKANGKFYSYLAKSIQDNKESEVKFFFENGFILANEPGNGGPYLKTSIENNNIEISRLLLQHSAEINTKVNAHQTLLDYAQELGKTDLYKLLKDAGAKTYAEVEAEETYLLEIKNFNQAISTKNYRELKRILSLYPEISMDIFQMQVLCSMAVEKLDKELFNYLLSRQMNPNISVNSDKQNALHISAKLDNEEMSRFLIEKGVDPLQMDKLGQYPFQLAKTKQHRVYLKSFTKK